VDYNFKEIEKKWQKIWDDNETFKAGTDLTKKNKLDVEKKEDK